MCSIEMQHTRINALFWLLINRLASWITHKHLCKYTLLTINDLCLKWSSDEAWTLLDVLFDHLSMDRIHSSFGHTAVFPRRKPFSWYYTVKKHACNQSSSISFYLLCCYLITMGLDIIYSISMIHCNWPSSWYLILYERSSWTKKITTICRYNNHLTLNLMRPLYLHLHH